MKPIDEYILSLKGQQKEIISAIDLVLREGYKINGVIKWRIPFYQRKTNICYLNPIKNDGVEFVFYRGKHFSNQHGLLQSKGRKQVAGIELYSADDIPEEPIHEIIEEAILLDDRFAKK